MDIIIKKCDVIDELHRQTALLAMKNENGVLLVYNEDDADRVEPLWFSSLNDLLQQILPFAKMSVADDVASYMFMLPSNWDDSHIDALQQLAFRFVVFSFVARWLDNVKPETALVFRSLNTDVASSIKNILSRRKKPLRD